MRDTTFSVCVSFLLTANDTVLKAVRLLLTTGEIQFCSQLDICKWHGNIFT